MYRHTYLRSVSRAVVAHRRYHHYPVGGKLSDLCTNEERTKMHSTTKSLNIRRPASHDEPAVLATGGGEACGDPTVVPALGMQVPTLLITANPCMTTVVL